MRRRSATAVALVVAAVLGVAGCGGGSDNKGNAAPTATASAQQSGATAANLRDSAAALQQQFVAVVKKVSPTVVQIETSAGLGSGIVYDGKGDIVTNDHVVANANRFVVTLSDGRRHEASLVGTFPADDLAVIRVKGAQPSPATFGDSTKLKVGDLAFAIGNPLGLRSSVTQGIISSLGRTVSEGNNGVVLPSAIQTSAPINPGNSGGALVDLQGQVIGIPTLAALDPELGGSAAPGIGFAIPSSTVKRIADQLIANGHVTRSGRAYLGVRVATSVTGQGAIIASVENGGPADKAGIKSGELITSVDGHAVHSADQLTTILAGLKPGRTVTVGVLDPDGSKRNVKVTLGQLPGTS